MIDGLRRRLVCAVTWPAGTILLRSAIGAEPGSAEFIRRSFGVAALWTVGSRASGPITAGRSGGCGPVVLGSGSFAVFAGGALVVRRIPILSTAIAKIVANAQHGSLPRVALATLAVGAGEELFFRGAVYAATDGYRPVAVSTAVYTATNAATGNPALGLASVLLGTLWGQQRRSTGGVRAPTVTHLSWSALMLWLLPPMFRGSRTRHRGEPRALRYGFMTTAGAGPAERSRPVGWCGQISPARPSPGSGRATRGSCPDSRQ